MQKIPDLMRFRSRHVAELLGQLQDLQREPIRFTAAEDYNPQRRFFHYHGRDRPGAARPSGLPAGGICFLLYPHSDPKEREQYLKSYHGEYSGYSGGNDNRTYTGKGLSFSHGSITEPYAKVELNWSRIAKRIGVLIAQDRFLSEEDRGAMAGYEIKRLAQSIHNFLWAHRSYIRNPIPPMPYLIIGRAFRRWPDSLPTRPVWKKSIR